MENQRYLLKRLFNFFKFFEFLLFDSLVYVDCWEVRGDGDVIIDLVINIEYFDDNIC